MICIILSGFSISFGVDGLSIKVGGGRSECHWHEPLGGSGPPRKISKSRRSDMPFHPFGQAIL